MEKQKVKVQMSSDLEDIPNLCGITLQEAIINVERLEKNLDDIKQALSKVQWNEKETLVDVLSAFDMCRILLGKIDARLADSSSIVFGLTDIMNRKDSVAESTESKATEEKNDV